MQGWRDFSFLLTKKNPAPAGDNKGRMVPASLFLTQGMQQDSVQDDHNRYRAVLITSVPFLQGLTELDLVAWAQAWNLEV